MVLSLLYNRNGLPDRLRAHSLGLNQRLLSPFLILEENKCFASMYYLECIPSLQDLSAEASPFLLDSCNEWGNHVCCEKALVFRCLAARSSIVSRSAVAIGRCCHCVQEVRSTHGGTCELSHCAAPEKDMGVWCTP